MIGGQEPVRQKQEPAASDIVHVRGNDECVGEEHAASDLLGMQRAL